MVAGTRGFQGQPERKAARVQGEEPPPRRRDEDEAPPQGERVSAPQTRGRGCDKRRARQGERRISGAPARRGAVGRVAVATTGSPHAAGWPRSEQGRARREFERAKRAASGGAGKRAAKRPPPRPERQRLAERASKSHRCGRASVDAERARRASGAQVMPLHGVMGAIAEAGQRRAVAGRQGFGRRSRTEPARTG